MTEKEHSANQPEQQHGPRRRRTRRIALASLAAVFVLLASAYGGYWTSVGRFHQSTDDSYVAGNQVAVMTQEQGTVVAVLADDTMRIRRGQTLIRLDDSNARIALERAEAQLAAEVREISALHATQSQLQAQVAEQQATLALTQRNHVRDQAMHKLGYYSTQNLEHSATQVDIGRQRVTAAEQALRAMRARLQGDRIADNPQVRLAVAQVRTAWLALQRTRIVAPVSGLVAERSVQVGEDVSPGSALMAIVPINQLWVEANFKESQLGSIRVGQPADMHSDMFGNSVTFHGRVLGVGAGTGSAFSLLPPQNATGNWIKVVQRVPVRIGISQADLTRHPLRIGLSMDVTVETGRDAHTARGEIVDPGTYETTVYDTQSDGAQQLIARIIRDNSGGKSSAQALAVAQSGAKLGDGRGN
ncbi:MAG: efflux RND transporter periplasmic adaptor subunit [Gammaproteobacteria bacterium]